MFSLLAAVTLHRCRRSPSPSISPSHTTATVPFNSSPSFAHQNRRFPPSFCLRLVKVKIRFIITITVETRGEVRRRRGALRYSYLPACMLRKLRQCVEHDLGFSEIMATLARIGFFDTDAPEILKSSDRPTFEKFTCKLLGLEKDSSSKSPIGETDIAERIISLGHCKQQETALKTARTIMFLGFHEKTVMPASCQTTFDVTCPRMEERLAYSSEEQDMVLLYHEVEVEIPEARATEKHQATVLEFGKTEKGKTTSAMALTVGIPAAIEALVHL